MSSKIYEAHLYNAHVTINFTKVGVICELAIITF